jgi:hypothetical protein
MECIKEQVRNLSMVTKWYRTALLKKDAMTHFSSNSASTNRFEDIQDQLNELEEMSKSSDNQSQTDLKKRIIFVEKTKQGIARLQSLISSTANSANNEGETREQHLMRIRMLLEKIENELTKYKREQREL